MKRRGRKATGRKPKHTPTRTADSAKRAKGTTPKSAPRSRRPVDPDDDVFVPMTHAVVAPVHVTNQRFGPDDDDVFVPKPSLRQSDWVDDVGAPDHYGNPSIWEPFAGVKPRAGSPVGWSFAELYSHGLERKNNRDGFERVVCRYGCAGTTANVVGVSHHSHDCPYWTREGATRAPF